MKYLLVVWFFALARKDLKPTTSFNERCKCLLICLVHHVSQNAWLFIMSFAISTGMLTVSVWMQLGMSGSTIR